MKYKIYTNFFFINDNSLVGVGKLKRFNLNSFGDDVYIEFGESGFTSTNVEIRLKNLTQEEKSFIDIQETAINSTYKQCGLTTTFL